MSLPDQSQADLETLTALARSFAERDMFDEASELFRLALHFAPGNLGLKLNLAQVRYQQKQNLGAVRRGPAEAVREQIRRDSIDSAHFFGLAALYEERGKHELAHECLEIARRKDLVNPYVHKLNGKILLKRRHFDEAHEELRAARRYNPFDREVAELLGRVEYERGRHRQALEATIDAFLLLPDGDREGSRRLTRRIRSLKKRHKLSSPQLMEVFRQRRQMLQTAFDRLELQRERFLSERDSSTEGGEVEEPHGGRIELAARLRAFHAWSRLDDEQIFHLTEAVHGEICREGTKIFEHGSRGADIYVLERGTIVIRRPTTYGEFELATLRPGAVFGEVNFISRSERSGEAVAVEDCRFLRLDATDLEATVAEHPDLGVKLYLSFWHGLAQKLRRANEELRTFFSAERSAEELLKLRQATRAEAGPVEIDSADKIRLFREQGLSGSELGTLSNFSDVKRFPAGEPLFHEGDEGREMYVILEGKVMISKLIPGGGEEALAILKRGDFFGEMALIDGEPRSADAMAFQGPVTVVAFNQETLDEVLSMEPRAALDFMVLLCRLLAKRLREIDEKIIGWRIMASAEPGDLTDAHDMSRSA